MNIPWYDNYPGSLNKAYALFNGFLNVRKTLKSDLMKNFYKEELAFFLYESNNLEGIEISLDFTKNVLKGIEGLDILIGEINHYDHLSHFYYTPKIAKKGDAIIRYNEKSKFDTMLSQQLRAIDKFNLFAIRHQLTYSMNSNYRRFKDTSMEQEINYMNFDQKPRVEKLFTLNNIKHIHRIISRHFLEDPQAFPGKFRSYEITTGANSNYPAPEHVKELMLKFCQKSNSLLFNERCDPITQAAIISTDFVNIHPFPDFNGRTSRIMLNSVLFFHEYPFPISIRGNYLSKKRYLFSLHKNRRLQYKYISILLAREIVNQFERLNSFLKLSGLEQIKEDREYIDEYRSEYGSIYY